ncbi:MAG: nuclear transport factor 2 family protein [Acidimicrobiia bacterium]|nr:nuclear transport factor 2 family protein [Acidimicrobiia bacterium]
MRRLAVVVAFCSVVAACGTEGVPDDERQRIEAWTDEVQTISAATIAAWDARDHDAIRALYTEDITHDDDTFGAHIAGIEQVMEMAGNMFDFQVPDVRFRDSADHAAGFIGGDGGIMVWEAWDLFGFTEDDPLVEVDRLGIRSGRTSTWRLFYASGNPHDAVAAYASALTAGDVGEVAALYEVAAIRRDAVAEKLVEGIVGIEAETADFFDKHHDLSVQIVMPFGGGDTHGAIYSMSDADDCSVKLAVLLEIADGLIVSEEIYYDGESLLACDWLW